MSIFNKKKKAVTTGGSGISNFLEEKKAQRERARKDLMSKNENDFFEKAKEGKKIKGCVIDLYGTLVETISANSAWRYLIKECENENIYFAKNKIDYCLTEKISLIDFFSFASKPIPEHIKQEAQRLLALETKNIKVFDDGLRFLSWLTQSGIPWTIGSNLAEPYACALNFLPTPTVNPILSFEIGFKKPDKDFFFYCANQLKLDPEEILFIGDNVKSDINGALISGMKACLISRDGERPVPQNALRVMSLDDVPYILENIFGWKISDAVLQNNDSPEIPENLEDLLK